jgi:hypothetical protein
MPGRKDPLPLTHGAASFFLVALKEKDVTGTDNFHKAKQTENMYDDYWL